MKLNLLLLATMVSTSLWAQQTQSIYYTGSTNADGKSNITLGPYAGTSGGSKTVTLGAFAGQLNTAEGNVFVGYTAGARTTEGKYNSFMGFNAGSNNSTGEANTFLGSFAGSQNTTGSNNTFIGYQTGIFGYTGRENTFLGAYSGSGTSTGSSNTFLGSRAGVFNQAGGNNVFVGYQAGYSNTSASNNVFIGYNAGYTNTTGLGNLFMGSYAGQNSNGSYNLFIGNGSGQNNTSGLGNTFIGDGAGLGNATGQNNTYIGRAANFAGNGSGNQNTFIGFQARTPSGSINNSTAIGVNAVVSQDNSVILGAPDARVGIGNSAPQNKLEITQGLANQSGLRLTNLTSNSPASVTNQYKFLTVNSAGDVILGSVNGSAREGVSESLWQRKGSFLQSTQNDAVIIGSNVARTPSGYKLFVEEGILTEKVKVAVKNTNDWSDYVFKPNYLLRSLSEVEHYIQQHSHLPGMLSAKEVVEKGVDVAEMDAKLLEKIEELTLYTIQLEKKDQLKEQKIQQLETEMTELKALVKRGERSVKCVKLE
ncbi:hypothetical protein GCM10027592_61700 [Spirosoma flavus]